MIYSTTSFPRETTLLCQHTACTVGSITYCSHDNNAYAIVDMIELTISFPQTIPTDMHPFRVFSCSLMSPTKFAFWQNVLPLFPQVSPCCQFVYSDDSGIYWHHVSCMLKWSDVSQIFHHRKMSVITYSSHTGIIIRDGVSCSFYEVKVTKTHLFCCHIE